MFPKHPYYVLSFRQTTDALAAEAYCRAHRLPGRIIPLPREISAGCGLAWRVSETDYLKLKTAWQTLPVPVERVTRLLL